MDLPLRCAQCHLAQGPSQLSQLAYRLEPRQQRTNRRMLSNLRRRRRIASIVTKRGIRAPSKSRGEVHATIYGVECLTQQPPRTVSLISYITGAYSSDLTQHMSWVS